MCGDKVVEYIYYSNLMFCEFRETEYSFLSDSAVHHLLCTGNLAVKLLGVKNDNINIRVWSRTAAHAILQERCLRKSRQMPRCTTFNGTSAF